MNFAVFYCTYNRVFEQDVVPHLEAFANSLEKKNTRSSVHPGRGGGGGGEGHCLNCLTA